MLALKPIVRTTVVLSCTPSSLVDGGRVARTIHSGQCIIHIPSLRCETRCSATNTVGHVRSAKSRRNSFSCRFGSVSHRRRSIQAAMDSGESSTESAAPTEADEDKNIIIATATAAVMAQDPVSAALAATSIQQSPSETGETGPSAIGPVLTAIYAQCQTWHWKGMAINYVKQGNGSGPAVLLVHGFGASIGHFRK